MRRTEPDFLSQGSGNQVRSIRIAYHEHLDDAKVGELIKAAVASTKAAFAAGPVPTTVVKSGAAKHRPRS